MSGVEPGALWRVVPEGGDVHDGECGNRSASERFRLPGLGPAQVPGVLPAQGRGRDDRGGGEYPPLSR